MILQGTDEDCIQSAHAYDDIVLAVHAQYRLDGLDDVRGDCPGAQAQVLRLTVALRLLAYLGTYLGQYLSSLSRYLPRLVFK